MIEVHQNDFNIKTDLHLTFEKSEKNVPQLIKLFYSKQIEFFSQFY